MQSASPSLDSSLQMKIFLFVIGMHLALLLIGSFWSAPSLPSPKVRSKVAVQTIALTPSRSSSFSPSIPSSDKKSMSHKQQANPPSQKPAIKRTDEITKKQSKPEKPKEKIPSKKSEQKPGEIHQKKQEIIEKEKAAHLEKEQALLAKAKENLAKMHQKHDKIAPSSSNLNLDIASLPKEWEASSSLAAEGESNGKTGEIKEFHYRDEVIYRLKAALKLPDYGAVKIELSLDRTGKVTNLKIIQSESNKNKAYVERTIPTLLFSPFGNRFSDKEKLTFVISLQND